MATRLSSIRSGSKAGRLRCSTGTEHRLRRPCRCRTLSAHRLRSGKRSGRTGHAGKTSHGVTHVRGERNRSRPPSVASVGDCVGNFRERRFIRRRAELVGASADRGAISQQRCPRRSFDPGFLRYLVAGRARPWQARAVVLAQNYSLQEVAMIVCSYVIPRCSGSNK
jgi:hypothetical protein